MGIGAALIASAIIGAGSAAYSSSQQKKATKQASDRAQELEQQRREDEKLIRDASVTPESATVTFGVEDEDDNDELGSFNQFITPKNNQAGLGGTPKSTGLGFNV